MNMNDLIRAAAGRVATEPPPASSDPKRAHRGKADGGEGRSFSPPAVEVSMSSLLRAHHDDIKLRARAYERLADGRTFSGRELG
jgi:hypothetical protein